MKITYKNTVKQTKKFQQGGPVEAPAEGVETSMPQEEVPAEGGGEVPAEGGGEDPMMQLAQIFSQGLQNQDCQALAQGAQMFLQLLQQSQGGGQPQEPQGEPVFRRGGVLAYRINN